MPQRRPGAPFPGAEVHLRQAFVDIQGQVPGCRDVTGQFPAAVQGAGDHPPHLRQGAKHGGGFVGKCVEQREVKSAVTETLGHVRPGMAHQDQAHAPIPAQTPR